jgi:hypothetical protein
LGSGRGRVIEQCVTLVTTKKKKKKRTYILGKGAGIAQSVERLGCKLDDRAIEVDFLCSISSHSPSYQMGTREISPGVKWPEREADCSPPSSAGLIMVELYLHSSICFHDVMLSYEREPVNRTQMDIKHKTCDIRTWKETFIS